MTLENSEISERLSHQIFDFNLSKFDKSNINYYRRKRAEEAKSWGLGETCDYHKIEVSGSKTDITFFPGEKSENDMLPTVGSVHTDEEFKDMWTMISSCSAKDFERFKFLLVIIYRNAFYIDHKEVQGGKIRYSPEENIKECIEELNHSFEDILPGNLWDLLNYLDALGWNEDMKYQVDDSYDWRDNFWNGRMNNMLTAIKVPYKLSIFVKHILENSNQPEYIDFSEGLNTLQSFTVSRGVSKPTCGELEKWFEHTLYK